MASGNTLVIFTPLNHEPPAANYATLDTRNAHTVLDFDDTTGEGANFKGILPRHYAGGGITVSLHWAATTATTGTGGWTVAFERVSDSTQDIDADGFATAHTIIAATVPATSGFVTITSTTITDGVNIDSLAVGAAFRLQVIRDVANDTAVGDLELYAIELTET